MTDDLVTGLLPGLVRSSQTGGWEHASVVTDDKVITELRKQAASDFQQKSPQSYLVRTTPTSHRCTSHANKKRRSTVISTIEGLPANVVGMRAEGTVHSADYKDVLDPAIEAALAKSDKVRLLYVLSEEFEGYSGGALWADTKVGLSQWSSFERIALVTDRTAITEAMNALGWLMPGEAKVFALAELAEATQWVSE